MPSRSEDGIMRNSLITGVILAGGKSSRFGRDKAFEKLGGQSMICRVIQALAMVSGDINIVVSEDNRQPFIDAKLGQMVLVDVYPDARVLGGIYTGLINSGTHYILAVGCDMPFINPDLLQYMVSIARESNADVVVPTLNGKREVLHAIYSRNCIPEMQALLSKNIFTVIRFFEAVDTRYVSEKEIEKFDKNHLSFINVNTQADLLAARHIVQRKLKSDRF